MSAVLKHTPGMCDCGSVHSEVDLIRAERDALAARVEELEARIARAEEVLLRGSPLLLNRVDEARRILRGENA